MGQDISKDISQNVFFFENLQLNLNLRIWNLKKSILCLFPTYNCSQMQNEMLPQLDENGFYKHTKNKMCLK